MQRSTPTHSALALWRDQAGQVSAEYLVVTAMSLIIVVAIASLGLSVASSYERAHNVLLSDTP